jgi:hypothetical protein
MKNYKDTRVLEIILYTLFAILFILSIIQMVFTYRIAMGR